MTITRLAFLKQAVAAGALITFGYTPNKPTLTASSYGTCTYGTAIYTGRRRPRTR